MKLFSKKKDSEFDLLKLIQRLSYGRSVVGIDIGTSSVNVAQMANYKGKLTLIRTKIVDIIPKEGEDHDAATLRALQIALEDFTRRNIKYACVVSCPQTSVRRIVTPYMPKEELHGAVSLEVKRSIPFPLSDAVMDYNVIEEVVEQGVEKLSIVVAASPKKTVDRILSFFTPKKPKPFAGSISKKFDADKKPSYLDIKLSALLPLSLCLENVIERSKFKIEETLATIEMGTVVTELNIYKNSRLQFSRKIPFAGEAITQSLTGTLMTGKGKVELTLEEAEKIKREYGIPRIEENREIDKKITTNQVLSLIRPRIDQLVNEIERSFDFYREEMHGSKIERIVLFGGGAQLKGLPEFLSKELEVEVNVGNPLADIETISDDVVEDESDAHKLVLAIGAALSGLKGVNLLPTETKERTQRFFQKTAVIGGAAVAAAVLLVPIIPLYLSTHHLQEKLVQARQEMNSLTPELKAAEERMVIRRIVGSQPHWDEALKEVSNVIPPRAYLQNMKMKDHSIDMNGIIGRDGEPSQTALSKFMVALEDGILEGVKLVRTEKQSRDLAGVEFGISADIE